MRLLNKRPYTREFSLNDVIIYFDLETKTVHHTRKSKLEEWIRSKKGGRFGFSKYPLPNDRNSAMHGDIKFNNIRYTFDFFYTEKKIDLDISSILNGAAFTSDEKIILGWRYRKNPHQEILDKIKEFGYVEVDMNRLKNKD
ncbi:hypothetical protein HYW74_01255 [Candidatus Pacearchaeota archaeon]|nr:hypothetical protein [Candidatus Pacearchaeota archaeon]